MSRRHELKFRAVTAFQRRIANPVNRRLPGQVLLETTGRRSGLARRTPVGGRRSGEVFWMVSEYGEKAQYVRNIQADPRVRVRIRGRWHTGTARLLPEDDARARLRTLPRFNSAAVRAFGTNLLTVRVDLDGADGSAGSDGSGSPDGADG
ncbi:nitroreductase/quinone reductase family protein [Streptomyces nanshensis]|uniref:Nitroreductase n=1 Tax=Streptomyces nanshensis TaxID=518642 RepID=A0A1E7L3G5_9ACTN|nr:nitroreductase/quinone reductase family protein [Streptomyces nanshensis]OEV10688.1 nitroreductase [Streptomyces nanshensis]